MSRPYALWRAGPPLLLASASTVRRRLLEECGIPVEATPAGLDERAAEACLADRSPSMLARGLAEAKARAVSARSAGRLVLGADQTLALADTIYHKPRDIAEARRHLEAFSGRTHHLHSGLALVRDATVLWAHVESATLHVRTLSRAFIDGYLEAAGADVLASVGAYRLEAHGAHLFERIEGEHSTILGLPLRPLLAELRRQGCLLA
ncbi:MAG TPA: Maf family protein [Beijerinckiaceae bacterium]|mgnify:CR=1 FL=1|nr:Maf family protein [Beijerinckiaceae bacterium]